MTVLCLTGWQQTADALASIAPQAVHFDYSVYNDTNAMFVALPKTSELAIGWSLGGQLLVRAIAAGYIKPKRLVLLGAPFQCVADESFPEGMSAPTFEEFRNNYSRRPEKTLAQFNALVSLDDVSESSIARMLNASASLWKNGLFWLDELGRSSCRGLSFQEFPQTTIMHGDADKVIHPANAREFARVRPNAEIFMWPDCAHAMHLHNPSALRDVIGAHV